MMMGTSGAEAVLGALLVAYLGDFRRKGWFVLGGAILFGLCITGFALSACESVVDFPVRHWFRTGHFGSPFEHAPSKARH